MQKAYLFFDTHEIVFTGRDQLCVLARRPVIAVNGILRTQVNRAEMGSVLEDGLARANNLGGIGLMFHHESFAWPKLCFLLADG